MWPPTRAQAHQICDRQKLLLPEGQAGVTVDRSVCMIPGVEGYQGQWYTATNKQRARERHWLVHNRRAPHLQPPTLCSTPAEQASLAMRAGPAATRQPEVCVTRRARRRRCSSTRGAVGHAAAPRRYSATAAHLTHPASTGSAASRRARTRPAALPYTRPKASPGAPSRSAGGASACSRPAVCSRTVAARQVG